MTGGFWDRVTGEQVARLPTRPLLNRYQLAARGVVNGRDAPAYSSVLPTASGRWSASAFGCGCEGDFARTAMPGQALALRVTAIATALAEAAVPTEATYDRWAAVPPVATDLMAQLRGIRDDDSVAALEQAIDVNRYHLEALCRRPETNLRQETVVLPVARSRRLGPDAITYLTTHTEDWQKRTVWGVYPSRLRSIQNDTNTDLYENQAAVQLVDHLLAFLDWRKEKLETASRFVEDLEKFTNQLQDRPWRSRRRLSFLLGEVIDYTELFIALEDLIEQNARRRRQVYRLVASALYQDRRISRRTRLPAELRPTNLLTYHEDYRRLGVLWRAWARANREAGLNDVVDPSLYCDSFNRFVALLLARSLDVLGYRPVTMHAPAMGGPDLRYIGPGGSTLAVRYVADGTFEVRSGTDQLVTFVPLPHALTAEPEALELRVFADELDRRRRGRRPPRVVVYPGTRAERDLLPLTLHRRADTVGNDIPGGAAIGLLGVTPTEIDSVERMARALRWAIIAPDAAAYPPRVPCPSDLPGELLTSCEPWLATTGGGQVTLNRPPDGTEMEEFRALIAEWRAEHLPPARRREREAAAASFESAVEDALAVVRRLSRCPVCTAEADPRHGFRLGAGTFHVTCPDCLNSWGTQSCRWCGVSYPIVRIRPSPSVRDAAQSAYGLANELLAVPCYIASMTTAYMCPKCGRCGGEGTRDGESCLRCAELSPTPRKPGDDHDRR
jgi:hypothetical protein